jgi:hypothetical protein
MAKESRQGATERLAKIYFVIAVAALLVLYGYLVGHYRIFPASIIKGLEVTVKRYLDQRKDEFPGLNPARYPGAGVVVYKPGLAQPGVTLITAPFKTADTWLHGLRLVDMEGRVLHTWTVDPAAVWNGSPHRDFLQGKKMAKTDTYIHGAVLLPNGDVVFNLTHYALLRLNASSEIVWKVPYRTHHSVHMDGHGDFWVPGERYYDKTLDKFPGIHAPFVEDMILQVSPTGVIKRELSILETIFRSGYEGLLFGQISGRPKNAFDFTHNNDVEVLEERLADDFEGLNGGDIMVSLRNICTILIIDGKTELIKWAMTHPFIRQHDPDFQEGGFITVFDNRTDHGSGQAPSFGGSRIVRVRPFKAEVETIYRSGPENEFYTNAGGNHQFLPNGNLLITETCAGRVFEVTAEGVVVWSWLVEPWGKGDHRVPEVLNATRYAESFAAFAENGM